MKPEDLSSTDRELAQLALLRVHLGRVKRRQWELVRKSPAKRYDMNGRRLPDRAPDGRTC